MSSSKSNTGSNAAPKPARQLRCPRCDQRFARQDSPVPPFCSRRCKLLDLGDWLDESYRIAGDPAPDTAAEPDGD